MGIIKQGILGGFSNKVGSVVGSSWKGIAVMRSMPISVANPRTAAQVSQRQEFSMIARVGSSVLAEIIQPCWNRFAKRMSGYNAFVKENESVVDTTSLLYTLSDIAWTKGNLNNPNLNLSGDVLAGGTLTWGKNDNLGRYDRMDDTVVAVRIEYDTDNIGAGWGGNSRAEVLGTAKRIDETLTVPSLTPKFGQGTAILVVYVIAADGTQVSTSHMLQSHIY